MSLKDTAWYEDPGLKNLFIKAASNAMRGWHCPITTPKTTFTGINSMIDFTNHLGAFLKEGEKRVLIICDKDLRKYGEKVADNLKLEQERLNQKELKILKREQLKSRLEQRKEQAFKILDEGEKFLKEQNYDNAVVCYRRAGIILNELQFPTDSINNMIFKINKLKNQKVEIENIEVQKELEKFEEERALSMLIEERRRQEKEKKEAQQ